MDKTLFRAAALLKIVIEKLVFILSLIASELDATIYNRSSLKIQLKQAKDERDILTAQLRTPKFRQPDEKAKLLHEIDTLSCYIQGLEGLAKSGYTPQVKPEVKDGIEVLEKPVVQEFKLERTPELAAPYKVESGRTVGGWDYDNFSD